MSTINKISVDGTVYDIEDTTARASSGVGLTDDIKTALLNCFEKVAWIDADGQSYYDALESALYPPANLSSISCVYTQSEMVYDTDSLDSLKSDLVVTAHYDNATTQTVTTYTLSGTLTEGTSTITVSYGGKTTTFNVTVSVYSTAPSIEQYNKSLKTNGETISTTGGCYTNAYEYEFDIDAIKQTEYYDSTNNYSTTNGVIFKIKYCFPNVSAVAFGSGGKTCEYNTSGTLVSYISPTRDTSEHDIVDSRYNSNFYTLPGNKLRFKFSLSTEELDDSYAYWIAPLSGFLPIGVTAGDVIFAGANTPYYNKKNIND